MSFEHYPYEPCKFSWDNLYDEPKLITHIMQAWRDDGLPADVPMLATEVNLAWQTSGPFVDVFGGLWLANHVGAFLSAGGRATVYFQYFPEGLSRQCDDTWGGFTMFKAGASHGVEQPLSQYFAAQLITQEWVQPGDREHRVFPVASEAIDAAARTTVTAYAVQRPDGQWSLLLVNKDPRESRSVRVAFRDAEAQRDLSFSGDVAITAFGAENYAWHPNGPAGYADPDGPIARESRPGSPGVFVLPRASVTVLRGAIR